MNTYIAVVNDVPIASFRHAGSVDEVLFELENDESSGVRVLLREHAHADGRELLGPHDRLAVRAATPTERAHHRNAAKRLGPAARRAGDRSFGVDDIIFLLVPLLSDDDEEEGNEP